MFIVQNKWFKRRTGASPAGERQCEKRRKRSQQYWGPANSNVPKRWRNWEFRSKRRMRSRGPSKLAIIMNNHEDYWFPLVDARNRIYAAYEIMSRDSENCPRSILIASRHSLWSQTICFVRSPIVWLCSNPYWPIQQNGSNLVVATSRPTTTVTAMNTLLHGEGKARHYHPKKCIHTLKRLFPS